MIWERGSPNSILERVSTNSSRRFPRRLRCSCGVFRNLNILWIFTSASIRQNWTFPFPRMNLSCEEPVRVFLPGKLSGDQYQVGTFWKKTVADGYCETKKSRRARWTAQATMTRARPTVNQPVKQETGRAPPERCTAADGRAPPPAAG